MADQTRMHPKVDTGPEVLGKVGFWVALPGFDAADRRHLAMLLRVRRTNAAVATSAKRLELRIGELERQADQAAGNVADALADLRRDYAEVKAREERVTAASRRLQAEIDAFRQAKNAAKAAYIAAEEAAQAACAEMRSSRPQGPQPDARVPRPRGLRERRNVAHQAGAIGEGVPA
jgi:phage shock protein A